MLRALILDLDGTLTVPTIDFRSVRAHLGAPPERTLIEHIDGLPPDRAAAAHAYLKRVELDATVGCALNDGVHDLLSEAAARGLRTAVVTNTHREAMHAVIDGHALRFDAAFCRDDGPLKPAPDLIQRALRTLGLAPHEALGVGDGRYDIAACSEAGVRCVYLTHGRPAFPHDPSVATLRDLIDFL